MKKALLSSVFGLSLIAGYACAAPVNDLNDLIAVHQHIVEAIREMERASAANHYDMAGHGAKAEALLRQAEMELNAATASASSAVVRIAPPPPQVEVVTASPGPSWYWQKGHWRWNGASYYWVQGHWAQKPVNQIGVWIDPHWENRAGGWVFVEGHW